MNSARLQLHPQRGGSSLVHCHPAQKGRIKPGNRASDLIARFSSNLTQAFTNSSPVRGVNTTRERKAAQRVCLQSCNKAALFQYLTQMKGCWDTKAAAFLELVKAQPSSAAWQFLNPKCPFPKSSSHTSRARFVTSYSTSPRIGRYPRSCCE